MTVYIEKPAINLREELASLRNQGGYEEQQFYFDGLVTNGTFDADTNWTKGTGWTIGSGVASVANSGAASYLISPTTTAEIGKAYLVTFTISNYSAGNAIMTFGGVPGTSRTANGTYAQILTATSTGTLSIYGGTTATYSVDNVSVFETNGTDVVHRMPKGWVPKDVYEDGLLQREGSAHDYEVIYDGFDYFVKPTVAPSATTQTCVIGVKA